ncbi:MAG: ADP-ribosylglycohydrolase family protein [Candidatus Aenigmarchaeota archaeon]|nr:ADP-ribosylglycohydrolase family protein [Candidatus Aenigmarchaeota archaeon]
MEKLKSKFIGSLVGLALGDFLGAGGRRYTDDTAMMIGVAESLIESKGFNGENMAHIFVKNYENEPFRGYGPGPPRIFRMIKFGRKWNESLDKEFYPPDGSFGNGAAMRIAPVGLLYYDDLVKLREVAHRSSRITHSHPLGIEGAALEAYAVALAVKNEPKELDRYEFLKKLGDFVEVDLYREKLEVMKKLLKEGAGKAKVVRELGNGVEAFNSVPIAIYSFLANSSFETTLDYALNVSYGGDRDTISAMTSAIAGACYGIEDIPREWSDKLENKDYIVVLAEKLWETYLEVGSCHGGKAK